MQLHMHEEVQRALAHGGHVVALESSVIAQGLPSPHNLAAAQACEAAIRRAGSIPATIALIEGEIRVGISDRELALLAEPDDAYVKVGSRDLAFAIAKGRTGGTTVSATCEIATRAGIRVFATGGIGGVHRGVVDHFDISQDLWALSRFPVAVVCAGAKSILDLPKTLELLESLSVPVVGVGTSEFPAFYSPTSGLALEHRVDSAKEAAELVKLRGKLKQGGLLFAQPPPAHAALDGAEIEKHLADALADATAQGIRGKAVTPFLLAALSKRTGGRTLAANIALLEHNAFFAGAIAKAL